MEEFNCYFFILPVYISNLLRPQAISHAQFLTSYRWEWQVANISYMGEYQHCKIGTVYLECFLQSEKRERFLSLKLLKMNEKIEREKQIFSNSTRHKQKLRSSSSTSCSRRASFSVPFVWLSHIWQEKGYLFLLHLPVILNPPVFTPFPGYFAVLFLQEVLDFLFF